MGENCSRTEGHPPALLYCVVIPERFAQLRLANDAVRTREVVAEASIPAGKQFANLLCCTTPCPDSWQGQAAKCKTCWKMQWCMLSVAADLWRYSLKS